MNVYDASVLARTCLLVTASLLGLGGGSTLALAADQTTSPKNRVLQLGVGKHKQQMSDFADYWGLDKDRLEGNAFDVTYLKDGPRKLAYGFSLGMYNAGATSRNARVAGDTFTMDLSRYHLSPLLAKYYRINETFGVYGRGGLDLYYTKSDLSYRSTVVRKSSANDDLTFGSHVTFGGELIFADDPDAGASTALDVAYSVFVETTYKWGRLPHFDRELTTQLNVDQHDHTVGGLTVMLGLGVHF